MKIKVKGIYADDVNILLKKGDKGKVDREVRMEEDITAPVKAGQKIGEVIFKIDDKEVTKADVVADSDVERASFIRLFFRMILEWFGIGRK